MDEMLSACGVFCSGCGAFRAASKGAVYQKEVADAWHRIYGLNVEAAKISCGGCQSPDKQVFYSSVQCTARRCCLDKGLRNCSDCLEKSCALLERAQSAWDGVPQIGAALSPADFEKYARPYCGHRERLAAMRGKIDSSR